MAVGAFLFVAGGAVAWRVCVASLDRQALQHRIINRELGQENVGWRRQVAAARDAVSRLITDQRTAPHDRLALEEHVAPLLVERGAAGSALSLAPAPNWWRRLFARGRREG